MRMIIVGCGRMGAGLAQNLGLHGHSLAVVDQDVAAFERLGPSFAGTTICGVGFDRDVLLRAGIEHADGLAAVTGSDEVNVVTARLARLIFHVPRVVARLYDPRKAEIYRRLGLQTIAPVPWGINRLVELLSYVELNTLVTLGSGQVEIVEQEIPPLMVGRSVDELAIPGEVQVVAISRNGRAFLPTPGTIFQQGDLVHLALLVASAGRLHRLLAAD